MTHLLIAEGGSRVDYVCFLWQRIATARAGDLPGLPADGLGLDIHAVTCTLTLQFHNARTKGVNTKIK